MAELDYQPKPKVIEQPERDPRQGFDLRVHIKDAQTGELIRVQPYDLHIVNGMKYYERPCKSGNLFFESGEEAGRWVKAATGYAVDAAAKHVDFMSPKTELRTASDIENENDTLRAELAALKEANEAKLSAMSGQQKSPTK